MKAQSYKFYVCVLWNWLYRILQLISLRYLHKLFAMCKNQAVGNPQKTEIQIVQFNDMQVIWSID